MRDIEKREKARKRREKKRERYIEKEGETKRDTQEEIERDRETENKRQREREKREERERKRREREEKVRKIKIERRFQKGSNCSNYFIYKRFKCIFEHRICLDKGNYQELKALYIYQYCVNVILSI